MLRTLSARILLGFAALTVTFGVTIGMLIYNTSEIESQVDLTGNGYVKAALAAADLQLREEALITYLEQQITDERSASKATLRLKTIIRLRDNALEATRAALAEAAPLAEDRDSNFSRLTKPLDSLRDAIASEEANYTALQAKPPLGQLGDATLEKTKTAERRIGHQADEMAQRMRDLLFGSDERHKGKVAILLRNEHLIWQYTIIIGFIAVVLGLALTVWAVITLRPINRLREGARRVAAGDYASRIGETGPTEVAELAREFNSMAGAIESRERELVRSERLAAVGKMAAMITHEVRNPLSSIGLNTELLEDELDPDATEARSLCRAITREVDRLTAITEEYLAFARLPKPKLASESVNNLVEALAAFVREDLAAKKITLALELDKDDPHALVDVSQLRQCLINLVRNAADAVGSKGGGGTITLRTRRSGAKVTVEVADDGVGIPADLLPKLFDPFFSTKDSGSGLGLALTQQIVKDHGGDLGVTSTVGRGTTFTLAVPCA